MIVQCIDDEGGGVRLTLGKFYHAITSDLSIDMYIVKNDNEENAYYKKVRFKRLEELE